MQTIPAGIGSMEEYRAERLMPSSSTTSSTVIDADQYSSLARSASDSDSFIVCTISIPLKRWRTAVQRRAEDVPFLRLSTLPKKWLLGSVSAYRLSPSALCI